MSEATAKGSAGKGLGIAGLVLGILALVFSFVPCLGMYAAFPGIIAIILSVVGLISASKNQGAKGINIAALVIAILGTGIAVYQYFVISSTMGDFTDAIEASQKEYSSCDELVADFELNVEQFTAKMEEISAESTASGEEEVDAAAAFGAIGEFAKFGAAVSNIQIKIEEMDCMSDEGFKAKIEELNTKWSEAQSSANGIQ